MSPPSEFKIVRRGSLNRAAPMPFEFLMIASVVLFVVLTHTLYSVTSASAGDWKFWCIVLASILTPAGAWLVAHPRLEIKVSEGACTAKWLSGIKYGKTLLVPVHEYSAVEIRRQRWSAKRTSSEDHWLCLLKHESDSAQDFVFYQLADIKEASDAAAIISQFLSKPIIRPA